LGDGDPDNVRNIRETLISFFGFYFLRRPGWGWFCKTAGMTHQTIFSQNEFADKRKMTRREKILGCMKEIIPWT